MNQAATLGIAEQVHFLGQVKNPFKYIARAEVLLATSQYEGFSNVIVEALACRTCVVSTDCPSGPREILAPDTSHAGGLTAPEWAQYGVLVGVGDVRSIIEAINRLLDDTGMQTRYAGLGPERAADFEASRVAKQYLQADRAAA